MDAKQKQLFVWIRVHSWLRTHTGLEGLWLSRFEPTKLECADTELNREWTRMDAKQKQLFVWIRVHSWVRNHTGLEGRWPSRFGPAQARVRGHRTEPRMDTNGRETKTVIRVDSRAFVVENSHRSRRPLAIAI